MRSAEALLLDVLGAVLHAALALTTMGRTQVLTHHALLAPGHAAALATAVTDAQAHTALDIGAALGSADATAAVCHTQPLALSAARAALALTPPTAAMADAQATGHGVA